MGQNISGVWLVSWYDRRPGCCILKVFCWNVRPCCRDVLRCCRLWFSSWLPCDDEVTILSAWCDVLWCSCCGLCGLLVHCCGRQVDHICVFYQNKSGAVASDGGVAVVILAPSDIAWWGRHDLFWHINVKQRLPMVPLGWRWDDRYSWLGFIEHRWYVTIVSHAGEYISTSGHGWTV